MRRRNLIRAFFLTKRKSGEIIRGDTHILRLVLGDGGEVSGVADDRLFASMVSRPRTEPLGAGYENRTLTVPEAFSWSRADTIVCDVGWEVWVLIWRIRRRVSECLLAEGRRVGGRETFQL